jgi:hypothetical protein
MMFMASSLRNLLVSRRLLIPWGYFTPFHNRNATNKIKVVLNKIAFVQIVAPFYSRGGIMVSQQKTTAGEKDIGRGGVS